jgi:hypothetical protein
MMALIKPLYQGQTCSYLTRPLLLLLLLLAEFEQHGAAKAEIMMDKMTNRSRGFGFVWFNSRAGMEDAIRDKHNAEIDGRRISVKEAIPQEQIPPGELSLCRWSSACTYLHSDVQALLLCP